MRRILFLCLALLTLTFMGASPARAGDDLDEEQVAELILKENHLLVHPGYFYDMDPHHLILSFVQTAEIIREVFPKLVRTIDAVHPSHR